MSAHVILLAPAQPGLQLGGPLGEGGIGPRQLGPGQPAAAVALIGLDLFDGVDAAGAAS